MSMIVFALVVERLNIDVCECRACDGGGGLGMKVAKMGLLGVHQFVRIAQAGLFRGILLSFLCLCGQPISRFVHLRGKED